MNKRVCNEICFECIHTDCINDKLYSENEYKRMRAACKRYYYRNREKILAHKKERYAQLRATGI